MSRWSDKGNKKHYYPKITTYELINEDKRGNPYKEMDYVLISDIPDKYIEDFQKWIDENQFEICVCIKEYIEDGTVVYEEIKAVNVLYWWRWFRKYGKKL